MTPDKSIINRLLEVREGDERTIGFYLTGLLQPFTKPFGDVSSDKEIHFAILESDVRVLIKAILSANFRHIENQLIIQSK